VKKTEQDLPLPFRTRFAPSPTGYLHLGHAFAAEQAFDAARQMNGVCLLRIEDIDPVRCRPEYEPAMIDDLIWLGHEWPEPVRRQSEHFGDYAGVLKTLQGRGLIYRSFLTRKELKADLDRRGIERSPAGERAYPGMVRPLSADEEEARLAAGEAFSWRLSLAACRDVLGEAYNRLEFEETGPVFKPSDGRVRAHPEWLGDVIIARKDTPTSYHIAVTHDDEFQKITHIVRGADLYYATHVHVLIQAIMDWRSPVYFHHPVLLGDDGRKLSKSHQSKTLRTIRNAGISPGQIRRDWT
jgi:glutamyl-Q tRNA(Asp) synthetase